MTARAAQILRATASNARPSVVSDEPRPPYDKARRIF